MAKRVARTESGILGTVHKTATGLHRAGVINNATMGEFDALCLPPVTSMGKLNKLAPWAYWRF
jgi:putative transcriptional regulator